jgi:hypothetical protein
LNKSSADPTYPRFVTAGNMPEAAFAAAFG